MASPPEITLRDYLPTDFDAIYQIDRVCYSAEIAYSREDLREYLRFPGAECVLACDAGKPIGFCITAHRGSVGYIVTIDVLASYRRLGVATQLLEECEARLASAGVHAIHLETATNNQSAIAFWKKHGYRTRALKKDYYPGGLDAFAMTKKVTPAARIGSSRNST
jgi:[ribosomal protein S18]-alanine N-acetyltransferase